MLGEALQHVLINAALVPAAKAAAVNPDKQRRRLIAVDQVQIEGLLLVVAVLFVRMRGHDALAALGTPAVLCLSISLRAPVTCECRNCEADNHGKEDLSHSASSP